MTHVNNNSIACLGEAMLELSPVGGPNYALGVAGDALNTAAGISLLGRGSAFVSATGNDHNSALLKTRCDAFNIDTRHLKTIESASIGLYLIANDDNGERFFSYWRDQSAAHQLFSQPARLQHALDGLADYQRVYLSGITLSRTSPASRDLLWSWLRQFRQRGGQVIYDGNYRPALWDSRKTAFAVHQQAIDLSTLFLPGMEDELALRGLSDKQLVRSQLESLSVPEMVIKDGAEPLLVYTDNHCITVPTNTVSRLVDTSGAGDSFNAGYLAARMTGLEPTQAAEFASQVSAMVIQQKGAIPAISHWQPLRQMLEQPSKGA